MSKRRSLRRLGVLLLSFIMLISAIPVYASIGREDMLEVDYTDILEWPEAPEIDSAGAYLIELNTGTVIYEKEADTAFYPASITKILTALVVLENCELTEEVTFSYNSTHDLESGGYSYIASEGDVLTVEDCLYALLLASSNEAAYALAEHVGGSISGFADMMNAKAAELGCTNSHFANPHGLYNEEHYTTPRDMAIIMWAALQNEEFLTIDSTLSYTTAPTSTYPDGFPCTMHHGMMVSTNSYYNPSVVAGKTGYISAAKNTLVSYIVEGDLEFICVVMCADGSKKTYADTQSLLDYALENFSYQSVSATVDLGEWEDAVWDATSRLVQNFTYSGLTASEDGSGYTVTSDQLVYLPNSIADVGLETVLVVDEDSYSASDDEVTATLTYSYNGIELCSESLTVTLAEQKGFVWNSLNTLTRSSGLPLWLWAVILLVVVLVILLILLQINSRKHQRALREEMERKERALRQKELQKIWEENQRAMEANKKAEASIERLRQKHRRNEAENSEDKPEDEQ